MSNLPRSTNSSIFVVNDFKAAKAIQGKIFNLKIKDNSKLGSLIVRGQGDKEISYSINEKKISLVEIELNIDAIEFIEKVRNDGFSNVKIVPSHFMRTICIRNIKELSPILDLYYVLKNLTQDIKKIFLVEDPCTPGLNKKVCIVEYNSYLYAKKALNILNSLGSNNTSYSNRNISIISTDTPIDAVWCEPLTDTVKEILKKTPFAYFENLLINNYNLFEFKQFLEEKLSKGGISNLNIKKIRQFSNKVIVEFNQNLPLFLFESPLYYEGNFIPIIPAMHPHVNVGKYKDRHFKASFNFLNEEDKKLLLSRFGDEFLFYNESLRMKAEGLYSKLLTEEKKERMREKERDREREREKERDREKEKERDKEREIVSTSGSMHHKRDRDIEEQNIDRQRDQRGKKKDRREREKSEDRERSQKTNGNAPSNLVNPVQASTNPLNLNPNYLSQLTTLLLNNPNSNVLSNLQNLSVLGNLQNLLSNPGLVTMLQNLVNTTTNPNPQTNLLNTQTTTSNSNQQSKMIPTPISSQTSSSNFSSSQINPIYNIPKSNIDQIYYTNTQNYPPKNFYPPNGTQQFPFQMTPEMYMNQMQYGGGMGNLTPNMTNLQNINMQPEYTMNPNPQETIELDNNMMKKYYEYFQNMNK